MFFLLWFLVVMAQPSQRRNSEESLGAISLFIKFVKAVASGKKASGWCPFETAFLSHVSKDKDGYFPTAELFNCQEAERAFGELGLEYPHHLNGGVQNGRHCMNAMHLTAVMLRCGNLPDEVLFSLASFVEDGCQRFEGIWEPRLYPVPLGIKRLNVSRTDKSLVWQRFLMNVEHGVRSSMEVQTIESDVAMKPTDEDQEMTQRGEPENEDALSLRNGEQEGAPTPAESNKKYFRGVIEEGSILL